MAQAATLLLAPRPRRGGVTDFFRRLGRHPTAAAGGVILSVFAAVAFLAPTLTPADPNQAALVHRLAPPGYTTPDGSRFHLGTDQLGRDILSRIILGARVSLLVGGLTTAISLLLGLTLGMAAGFFRGSFDMVVSRFADVLMAFPYLIFAIGAMAVLGPGFWNLILALSFKGWVEFFRLVRGETLVQQTRDYVEAARALGAPSARIIRRHIAPNIIHTSLVLATLRLGSFIVLEASLSFLGLGIPPRIPAWGSMVADGREVLLTAWWVSTFPGLAIVLLVLAVNLFGEGTRDILDPRLRVD
ncbi:MAG: ABC transporter permease [Armatimonadota bacterium]|nr:ABC transporter permease [Armatimonadota bacterium]MDR7465509.1 ABC transporter permease [Armatimonadota bacterium]MDR7469634.1 ABC transporter permease [Armatimonadota bacterium]MDR7474935.1 ABC transporter permease [Armatimonadota bacterium]MDR7538353.1 ABC transporter permease [Armatimonadota bacterium]